MFRLVLSIVLVAVSVFGPVQSAPVPAPPPINAKSYILLDHESGEILAERDPDSRLAPASITKLMTAYLIFKGISEDRIQLDDEVYVSEKAWRMEGSRMFIEVGKRVKLDDLLRGMIIQSGNDASVALAEHLAGTESVFAAMMNAEAQSLGMTNSHFVNATGLPDPEHYMSARDIATLAQAIIRDAPEQYGRYSEKDFTYNNITQSNRNKLLWRDPTVDGLKTGYTKSAGYCLVSSAERDGMRLISVVLGTESSKARLNYSAALLNYGFRFFETHRLYAQGDSLAEPRIWKGEQERVPVGVQETLYVTIPRGQYNALDARMEFKDQIVAPVDPGQRVGTLVIALDGQDLKQETLIALKGVPTGGIWRQAVDTVLQWWNE